MQKLKIPFLIGGILVCLIAQTQSIQILSSGTKTSLRGLSVVNKNIIWASGSGGMVAKTTDGGLHWNWMPIKGFEKREFRDIEAFDSNTAIIMCIAEPAVMLKTKDGGKNWNTVFTDSTKGMFLDAMDFADDAHGVVIGDPIDSKTYMAITKDGGDTWQQLDKAINMQQPLLDSGEAFFASSGSNIKLLWNKDLKRYDFFYASGGKRSRLFINGIGGRLPIVQGLESTGANSIDVNKNMNGVIVGGDFAKDSIGKDNAVLFELTREGPVFSSPITAPHGYRSSVVYINKKQLIACGTSGVDISNDGGLHWRLISKESFHAVKKSKQDKTVYLAGKGGRIARFIEE